MIADKIMNLNLSLSYQVKAEDIDRGLNQGIRKMIEKKNFLATIIAIPCFF